MSQRITIVSAPALAAARQMYTIIDVREAHEWESGIIPGALTISRGSLETAIGGHISDVGTPIALYCAGGTRSALAADSLQEVGYANVVSLDGGIKSWKDAGLALAMKPGAASGELQRYAMQMKLIEVGEAGQAKLRSAKVLVVGAGGLGSPAAFYLAAAGIGTLGIVDDDKVDLGNLHRQILHTTDRIGLAKVDSAFLTLKGLNPTVDVQLHRERLTKENADRIIGAYDIVVDGTDNFQTRYLINDACVNHHKPNVHGSVFWFEGQVSTFTAADGPCYRCLFPQPPPPELAPNCADAGVLGVLPGTIGLLQATEVLKLVLGFGESLVGKLLTVNLADNQFHRLTVSIDPSCVCQTKQPLPYVDYDAYCATRG